MTYSIVLNKNNIKHFNINDLPDMYDIIFQYNLKDKNNIPYLYNVIYRYTKKPEAIKDRETGIYDLYNKEFKFSNSILINEINNIKNIIEN